MADPSASDEFSPEKFKLAEILARNPDSLLFIPLAEEFAKAGRMAEAILILEEGLKTHPASLPARVALGRAYYQTGDNTRARTVLEEAVEQSPENLSAHRTLAEIYVEENALGPAMRSCSVLLAANAKDEEVLALKAVIERRLQPPLEFDVQELRHASLHPSSSDTDPEQAPVDLPADAASSRSSLSPASSAVSSDPDPSPDQSPGAAPSTQESRAWKVAKLRQWLERIEQREAHGRST